ncbi:ROK family protein [Glaciibacter psychrotolerans]|uniref:Glucokinase n=1 Tax=Glaciibacter psychrotolerans TaxID=670054 RepID=A0A7Z0EB77_9MICO|nr:ROK family protein [Leifsonia psychrotolerans]NYJ18384.1 glucokinase [Leifsonia psychrotolerans]
MNSSDAVVLAVDVGGTTMKGAVVTVGGETVVTATRPTPATDIVRALVDLLEHLAAEAATRGLSVESAGVVTPGMVDEETGTVLFASNLNWRDVPLLAQLRSLLPFPIAVGHDVRAAGLAEKLLGAARGSENYVHIPIGTGVAAALVSSGRTITGALGATGEFGHIPVIAGGEPCVCGQNGCLEVYASGGGVARRYVAAGGEALSTRQIVAQLGVDPIADEVWGDAVRVLAQGLTIMTLLLDPDIIVLGGGFSQAGAALLDPLRVGLANGLAWRDAPRVVQSQLGSEAGRIGASVLAMQVAGHEARLAEWAVAH